MQAEALTLCQQLERSADTLPGGLAMYPSAMASRGSRHSRLAD